MKASYSTMKEDTVSCPADITAKPGYCHADDYTWPGLTPVRARPQYLKVRYACR